MERWQQIEEIFHEALQRDPAQRDAYLRQACGSDSELHGEVAGLLANHHRGAGSELWAAAAAVQLIDSPDSVQRGQSLGPYRIESFVAAGGMGEVYRATDTRLNREVAIKISSARFSDRFEREARAIASLNHPNICQLYDVGPNYLVMELVEGPTLADRIRESALQLDEALALARQIAEALEAAHEKGRIHRDLKPANVKITPGGVVKLLDFGLAKAAEEPSATGDPSDSPTMTLPPTRTGIILGTAAYMPPEQARGQTVDKRADIWAFGCVLFEMLTGRPAFKGETTSDILAAVIKEEPNLGAIPLHLREIIAKCLRKEPRGRWRDIGDVRMALEDAGPLAIPPVQHRSLLPWALAGVLAIALVTAGVALWRFARPVQHPLMQVSLEITPAINPTAGANVVVSPDGRRLVFPLNGADGKPRLATRLLSQAQSSPLTGTEDLQGEPAFFSPDGEWVGFFAAGKLKKIPVQGGAPVIICDVRSPRGASWGEDDNIVFAPDNRSGLFRVPANGGVPQPLTDLKPGELTHRWPQVLPGARSVLFSANTGTDWENATIEIQSLKTGHRKTLHKGGSYGRYVPTGHLVYVHESTLFATAFNLDRQELTGLPTAILSGITNSAVTGSAQFDLSPAPSGHGMLVYRTGEDHTAIYSLDSAGATKPLYAIPGFYMSPRFSPDGKRLVVALFSGNTGLWILDSERDSLTRLTSTPGGAFPVWSPDGKHIVYESALTGFFWVRSDGSTPAERLMRTDRRSFPSSFSPDGKWLSYTETDPETGADVWMLPIEGSDTDYPKPGKPEPFLRTAANEGAAVFSPDGRWIAYGSDESGKFEVYVRPFPGPGGKWRISTGGGRIPVWSKSGRELAYEGLDHRLIMVSYSANGDTFIPGKPRLWSTQQIASVRNLNMDLAPDGKRFAVLLRPPGSAGQSSGPISLLLNFFDDLKQRVPSGGK